MNCLILLLLLFGCGNQNNGNDSCWDNDRDQCDRRDRCDRDDRRDRRDRDDRRDRRDNDWQDYPNLNRGETCGCEENNIS